MKENIERLFYEEVREKKKTGNGVYSRKGKGVKHNLSGSLRTPSYYMTNKEKKQLDGVVTMSNIYQSILPLNEFILKDKETQKMLLTKWREIHSNKTIMEQMNIKGNQAFANLIKDLGVPKKKVKTGGRTAKLITDSPTVEKINATQTPPATQEIKKMPVMLPEIINGLKLAYHGEYTADELARLFTKLQLLTDGEKSKFRIALSLIELTEEKQHGQA